MGNLGPYEGIVTAAYKAGGVAKWINSIEEAAVAKAFPKAFGKGVGVGVLGTLAGGVVAVAVKRYLGDKKAREALANEAKEQLKTKVEESMKSDGVNLENGEDESDSDGGK